MCSVSATSPDPGRTPPPPPGTCLHVSEYTVNVAPDFCKAQAPARGEQAVAVAWPPWLPFTEGGDKSPLAGAREWFYFVCVLLFLLCP